MASHGPIIKRFPLGTCGFMSKLTTAFLIGAWTCLALTVAALFWRGGLGVGAAMAALFGGLGLGAGVHALVAGAVGRAQITRQIGAVREAHRLLADALESLQGAVGDLAGAVQTRQDDRTEALTGEVRMLEALVARLSDSMDAKLAAVERAAPPMDAAEGRRRHQSVAVVSQVREALTENRVDLYLQPIVTLPQRKTLYYESFTRLRDDSGRVMMPAEYLAVAEDEGLTAAIDNLLLFRCAQIVRRLARQDRRVGVFCNIALTSLADETFFPQFLEFLSENRDLKDSLIFELGQANFDVRGPVEARNMAKLADLGFRFSIDKVQALDLDFADLQRSDVKFIKVSAELLLEQLLDLDAGPSAKALRDIHPSDFAELARRYGLEVIAEKVEAERQIVDILDLDVSLGQGHLFGEPRAIQEQVLAEAEPPADFVRAAIRGREPGPRRRYA